MSEALAGRILTPEGWLEGRCVLDEGRVVAFREGPAPARWIVPGAVDLHVHGGGGADVMDGPEGIAAVAAFHLRQGTTALSPTTVTRPLEELEAVLRGAAELGDAPGRARLLGVHLEGPFLNPGRLGAQPAFARPPEPELLERLLAAGPVASMTLAPELPGALEAIRWLRERGVRVSLGHSACSASEAEAAFAAGARGVTHLFNAMRGLHHREPGLVGAALEEPEALLELILDGHHVDARAFRIALRAARGRLALVSDAIRATGLEEGQSELGGQPVFVSGGKATLEDGTLAGSVLTAHQALKNACAAGVPLEEASRMLSTYPADALGRAELGRLAPGCWADAMLLEPESLELIGVVQGGDRLG